MKKVRKQEAKGFYSHVTLVQCAYMDGSINGFNSHKLSNFKRTDVALKSLSFLIERQKVHKKMIKTITVSYIVFETFPQMLLYLILHFFDGMCSNKIIVPIISYETVYTQIPHICG